MRLLLHSNIHRHPYDEDCLYLHCRDDIDHFNLHRSDNGASLNLSCGYDEE